MCLSIHWTDDDEVWTLGNDIDAAFFDEVNEEDDPWADMPDLLPAENESGLKGTQTEFRVSNICGDEHDQITHRNGDDDLDPDASAPVIIHESIAFNWYSRFECSNGSVCMSETTTALMAATYKGSDAGRLIRFWCKSPHVAL